MRLRSLAYRTDLALLRLGGTQVEDRGDHLVVRSPHNPAFWWGNFLLLAAVPPIERAPEWLDRFHAAFPEAEHVALGFDGPGTPADLDWFTERGYHCESVAALTATTVHPPAHANHDAVYRLLRSDDDWAQSVRLRMRTYDGTDTEGHERFVTAKVATNRELVEAGHGGWFGAFLDGRLVCQMGLFSADTGLARFQSVETDPDYRRLGLAGSLLHHVSEYGFTELRAQTLVICADPEYVAIELYRAVGFALTETALQLERDPAAAGGPMPREREAG